MKPLLKLFMVALVALAMTGCGVIQRLVKEPEERIVYKVITVPVSMTEKVRLPMPPHPETYSALPWGDQEGALMKLLQEHTQAIGTCNARLSGISDWSDRQYKLYLQPPEVK